MIADTFFKQEELPEIQESAGDMLQRLGCDGLLWAQDFRKMAVKLGYSDMDESWLLSWFCNAIMAGWDNRQQHYEKQINNVKNMMDIQCSPGNYDVNEYMRGMANGLVCAGSCLGIADVDIDLIDAPEEDYSEQMSVDDAYNDGIKKGKEQIEDDISSLFKPGDVVFYEGDNETTREKQKYTVIKPCRNGTIQCGWFEKDERYYTGYFFEDELQLELVGESALKFKHGDKIRWKNSDAIYTVDIVTNDGRISVYKENKFGHIDYESTLRFYDPNDFDIVESD